MNEDDSTTYGNLRDTAKPAIRITAAIQFTASSAYIKNFVN